MPTPRVVDTSHYNHIDVDGFRKCAGAGVWGVINKCTESTNYIDPSYAQRRQAVKDAGMLWGGYHFARPGSMKNQVDFFLRAAKPDDQTLLALDWEDNRVGLAMAKEFLQLIEQKVGRKAALYSGNTAKELLGTRTDAYFGSHRLWLAQYSARAVTQRSWQTYWLWQYSGDGKGPLPHNVPGILIPGNAGSDMNTYVGDRGQLTAEWASDGGSIPQTPETPSHDVKWAQDCLNKLDYGPLAVDGDYGPLTKAAVKKFQKDHPPLEVDGVIGPATTRALEQFTIIT